ncbi:40S ribosomal protein S23, putative, partial [Plasmodium malariae]
KPSGLRAARKLRIRRRTQRWADKSYKKSHLGTRWKSNPFRGSSHAKGIVVEKVAIEAKQVKLWKRNISFQCIELMGQKMDRKILKENNFFFFLFLWLFMHKNIFVPQQPLHPNSAYRKCVRVQLIKNGKKITAFVPGDGCLNFIDENDEVLVSGFGRSGHSVGDLPGVKFKVVKVARVSLLALFKEKKEKPRS